MVTQVDQSEHPDQRENQDNDDQPHHRAQSVNPDQQRPTHQPPQPDAPEFIDVDFTASPSSASPPPTPSRGTAVPAVSTAAPPS
jgi:hypothetical protein